VHAVLDCRRNPLWIRKRLKNRVPQPGTEIVPRPKKFQEPLIAPPACTDISALVN
jgi:hypothetical protein